MRIRLVGSALRTDWNVGKGPQSGPYEEGSADPMEGANRSCRVRSLRSQLEGGKRSAERTLRGRQVGEPEGSQGVSGTACLSSVQSLQPSGGTRGSPQYGQSRRPCRRRRRHRGPGTAGRGGPGRQGSPGRAGSPHCRASPRGQRPTDRGRGLGAGPDPAESVELASRRSAAGPASARRFPERAGAGLAKDLDIFGLAALGTASLHESRPH